MARPIIIAHHLVWTAYGWWLPNDPRGSNSQRIRSDIISALGQLHEGRKKLQPASAEVRSFYGSAATRLKHELRSFDEPQRRTIGKTFAEVIADRQYMCYACAIMPDHVHVLIRKHRDNAEQMIEALQSASRLRLRETLPDSAGHPIWGGPGWKVFLDHPEEVRRTIGYIENNPLPLGLPHQRWPFVRDYDGWPLHPGHSPNSPYARRLRAAGRYP